MNNFNTNQFFDFLKPMMNQQFFTNSMKDLPQMDFSSFTNMVKKNTESLTTTNQMISDNLQSIVKRSAEVFQNNANEMFQSLQQAVSAESPTQASVHQQEYIKNSFTNSINNTKEIMDMVSKSSMELFESVGKNVSEQVHNIFDHSKKKN